MISEENAFLNGNRPYEAYPEVCMASYLTGHAIRVIPGLDDNSETCFGLITDKRESEKHKLFLQTEFEIQRASEKIVVESYGISRTEFFTPDAIKKYYLGNESVAFPGRGLPKVLPIDWVCIAKHARGETDAKPKELPLPEYCVDDEYEEVCRGEDDTLCELWTVASHLAGYGTEIKKDINHFVLLGAKTQGVQRQAFFLALDLIKKEQTKILESKGVSKEEIEKEMNLGLGEECFRYPERDIEEPIGIDWVSLAEKVQAVVLSPGIPGDGV